MKLIPKHQLGKKILNAFTQATLGANVAENPAIATASGWKQDKDGNWVQRPDKESAKLADNLAVIAETAISAPTLVSDVVGLAHIIRHPIQAVRSIPNIAKSAWWFGTHPNHIKVYHVNQHTKEAFDLRNARVASKTDIGLHVSPNKESFKAHRLQGYPVMEGYS